MLTGSSNILKYGPHADRGLLVWNSLRVGFVRKAHFQLMYSWPDDQPAANTSAVMLLTVPIHTNSSHADIGISTRGMPVYWSDDNIWPGTSPAGCKYF